MEKVIFYFIIIFGFTSCHSDSISIEYLDTSSSITSENILYTNNLGEMKDKKISKLNYVVKDRILHLEILGYCRSTKQVVIKSELNSDTLFIHFKLTAKFKLIPAEEVVPFRAKLDIPINQLPKAVEMVAE